MTFDGFRLYVVQSIRVDISIRVTVIAEVREGKIIRVGDAVIVSIRGAIVQIDIEGVRVADLTIIWAIPCVDGDGVRSLGGGKRGESFVVIQVLGI